MFDLVNRTVYSVEELRNKYKSFTQLDKRYLEELLDEINKAEKKSEVAEKKEHLISITLSH
jgi:hypothetical protein